MLEIFNNRKRLSVVFIIILGTLIYFATGAGISEKDFVGKWQSTKLVTPIYLYANGEWEIKKEDGSILQYGVWTYKNKKLLWSYKMDNDVGHDIDPIAEVNRQEFKVVESDGSVTTFKRLE